MDNCAKDNLELPDLNHEVRRNGGSSIKMQRGKVRVINGICTSKKPHFLLNPFTMKIIPLNQRNDAITFSFFISSNKSFIFDS